MSRNLMVDEARAQVAEMTKTAEAKRREAQTLIREAGVLEEQADKLSRRIDNFKEGK